MTIPDSPRVERVQKRSAADLLGRTWERMTQPAASVPSLEGRSQARLLASFMLALTLLTSVGVFTVLLSDPSLDAALVTQITLALICAFAYAVSRSRFFPWAAVVAVGSIGALPLASYVIVGDYSELNTIGRLLWSLVGLLLANIFFRTRGIVISVVATMLAMAALPVFIPEVTFQKLFVILTITFITGILSLVSLRHRDQLEATRQTELASANRKLQSMSNFLETRVSNRTQALALAAEVGHAISQVRDLDDLLADAAEMIRARFALYYVQIYLADDSETNLVLRVGTGTTGKGLVGRGHRLYLGHGSIGGLAAADREAVVVPDTASSPIFHPNPLLPDTRSEIALPLLVGERVVGVLDLQSARVGNLTVEALPPFKMLASQLAIAIDNANLYAQVNNARAELESRAAKRTRADWRSFLDAVHRQEWSGYVYDQDSTHRLEDPLPEASGNLAVVTPISLLGQPLGTILLEPRPDVSLSDADIELVSSVATQVAQKVENLRLLAEAEQYRQEAEQSARRLIRKGWQEYLASTGSPANGFVYDQNRVNDIASGSNGDWRPELTQSLIIGDEKIGQLDVGEIAGDNGEVSQLLAAVAQQLGSHIENLRLSEQTALALSASEEQAARLAMLNRMSEEFNRAPSSEDIYEIAVRYMGEIFVSDQVSLVLITPEDDSVMLAAVNGAQLYIPPGPEISLEKRPALAKAVRENQVVIAPFSENSEYGEVRSRIIVPLIGDRQVIGAIIVGSKNPQAYSERDSNLLQQIAAILGATMESHLLAEQAHQRARRERILRRITARVHTAVDAQSVMRTAAQEINRALGLETFVYLDDLEDSQAKNGKSVGS